MAPVRRRVLAGLVACLLAGLLAPAGTTLAAFTDRADTTSPAQVATAGTLAVPATPTTGLALDGRPQVTWQRTDATSGVGAVPATGYQVFRYAGQTGDTGRTQVCPAAAGEVLPASARQCTADLPRGTFVAVVARFGGQWRRESARAAAPLALDAAPPTIAHTGPTPGLTAGSGSAMQNAVASACPAGGVACGTATDPSAPVTVQYALTRRASGSPLSAGSCWTGTAWEAAPTLGGCTNRVATVSGSAWRVPGALATAYAGNGFTFTLRVQATDSAGNTATSTITYSY